MAFRVTALLLLHLVLAGIGWLVGQWHGLAAGWLLANLLGLGFDSLYGLRLLRWLSHPDMQSESSIRGFWGILASQVQRRLHRMDQVAQEGDRRLAEFLAAIQSAPNGMVLVDHEGRIEWFNGTAAQHFGFDPQRDLRQHLGNLLRDPEFLAYFAKPDIKAPMTMAGHASTVARPVRLAVQVHGYGQGRKLLLSTDITARQQAEAMRRDFVANVSHEIRTPLTVLAGFIETLQNLKLSAQEQTRYLDLMAQQSRRMQNLVNDLLILSRLEDSPPPGVGERIPVQTLMAQCELEASGLSVALRGAGQQTLQFEVADSCSLGGVHNELHSAWSNLINNAIRYTPAGGAVTVRWIVLPDGRGEFSVRDSGPGIAAEHIPRLTERFYRVDRSRSRETGGTGLGLAIVKHVVQRHGAELVIESKLGQGALFAIRFPANRIYSRQSLPLAA